MDMRTIEITFGFLNETERIGIYHERELYEAVEIIKKAAEEWRDKPEYSEEYYAIDYVQEKLNEAGIENEIITHPDKTIVIKADRH